MAFHKPDLEEVFSDHVLRLQLKDFVHEGDLVFGGLFLEKNETEVPRLTERGKGGLVEITFFGAHPVEHVADDRRVDFLVDLVSFHRV